MHLAFEERGIACDRIELLGEVPSEFHSLPFGKRYYGFFERIDVVLDTLPWNGHTTTCETLWMGVPVVTLLGDRHAGRICASVLMATGLSSLIADTPEKFVAIAGELANNPGRLGQLREGTCASECVYQRFVMDPHLPIRSRTFIEKVGSTGAPQAVLKQRRGHDRTDDARHVEIQATNMDND